MARRYHRKHVKKESMIRKIVLPASFTATFLAQITGKDTAAISAAPDMTTKAEIVANSVVGRITGFNPFATSTSTGTALVQQKQTINPAGMFNKYTGIGVLFTWILPAVPGLPQKGLVKSVGKGALLGGILGGLFDDPKGQSIRQSYNSGSNSSTKGNLA